MAETQTSINIPQLIAVAIVGFLALRWFLNKPSNSSPHSSSSSRSANRGIDVAKVDQVSAMFPQLDRRHIAWDLQRNGGNVAATTERVLSPRGLETPPPSFRPDLPVPATTAAQERNARGEGLTKPGLPDLITRYNLQSRVGGKGKEAVPSEEQRRIGSSWSSDKNARADSLKRRREEMVLEARRRMEAKERADA